MRGRRVAVVGAGMTKFVRRAQETGKELSWQAAKAALESCELTLDDIDCVCDGHGARRVRRRAHEGRVPVGRRRRVRQAVHPHLRRRRHRRVRARSRAGTRSRAAWSTSPRGLRGEDVLDAAARAGRVHHDLRQHPRAAARPEPAVDLRARDEPLHDRARARQARHRAGRGQEQAERGGPPGGAARRGRHHGRGHPGVRGARVAGAAARRLAGHRRRRRRSCWRAEEARAALTDKPVWIDGVGWHLDTAYWTNRDLYYPRYVEYAARQAYEMAGIREPRKEIHVAEPYDPFDYKELHHLEGLLLFDKGKAPEAARDGVLNRDGDLPSLSLGRTARRRQPDRRGGADEDRRALLAALGRGRQAPGPRRLLRKGVAQAWGDLMQVGTVVVMGNTWRRAAGWRRRPRSACPAIPYPAPRGRRHLQPFDLADQPSAVGRVLPHRGRVRR